MEEEKSVLKRIREKELQMSIQVDQARTEADYALKEAKKKSLELLAASEVRGKEAADEFYQVELEKIHREADQVRAAAKGELTSVRERGEKNLPQAVERMVAIVLSG